MTYIVLSGLMVDGELLMGRKGCTFYDNVGGDWEWGLDGPEYGVSGL